MSYSLLFFDTCRERVLFCIIINSWYVYHLSCSWEFDVFCWPKMVMCNTSAGTVAKNVMPKYFNHKDKSLNKRFNWLIELKTCEDCKVVLFVSLVFIQWLVYISGSWGSEYIFSPHLWIPLIFFLLKFLKSLLFKHVVREALSVTLFPSTQLPTTMLPCSTVPSAFWGLFIWKELQFPAYH